MFGFHIIMTCIMTDSSPKNENFVNYYYSKPVKPFSSSKHKLSYF